MDGRVSARRQQARACLAAASFAAVCPLMTSRWVRAKVNRSAEVTRKHIELLGRGGQPLVGNACRVVKRPARPRVQQGARRPVGAIPIHDAEMSWTTVGLTLGQPSIE